VKKPISWLVQLLEPEIRKGELNLGLSSQLQNPTRATEKGKKRPQLTYRATAQLVEQRLAEVANSFASDSSGAYGTWNPA
jgi:hypothetical protein